MYFDSERGFVQDYCVRFEVGGHRRRGSLPGARRFTHKLAANAAGLLEELSHPNSTKVLGSCLAIT